MAEQQQQQPQPQPQPLRTKAQLLATVATAQSDLAALLAEAGPERLNEPGVTGDWTFKDVVAHLTGWRLRTIARLEAAASDSEPLMPWPAELGRGDEENVEAINQWMYAQNRERPAADILRESDASFRNLAAAVSALPDEDLLMPGQLGYEWLDGAALGPALLGGSSEHLYEHLHDEDQPSIRAWLARRPTA